MKGSKKKIIYASIASALAVVLIFTTIYCANRFGWFKKGEITPTTTPTATPTASPATPSPTNSLPVADGTYYEVTFASDDQAVVLPEPQLYEAGTPIYAIGTPLKAASIFTGWYSDADHTNLLSRDTVIDKNMTLYPSFAEAAGAGEMSINYVASQKVTENFEIIIEAYDTDEEALKKLITVINQTKGNSDVEYVLELLSERSTAAELTEAEYKLLAFFFNDEEIKSTTNKTEATIREKFEIGESENIFDYLSEKGLDAVTINLLARVFHFDDGEKAQTIYRYSLKPAGGKWRAGSLHQVEIKDTAKARFVYADEVMNESVVYYNFTVHKDSIDHLQVSDEVVFIPLAETSGLDIGSGFFSVKQDANGEYITERNNYSGSFEYTGSEKLHKDSIIAVYDGKLGADKRVEGKVSYFKLSADPEGSKITYISADVEEIVPIPEVFPVADDGSFNDGKVFIRSAELDFTRKELSDFNFTDKSEINVGDFLVFYKGSVSSIFENKAVGYAQVSKVEKVNGGLEVSYKEVSLESIQHSLEYFSSQDNMDLGLTDEYLKQLEKEIEEDTRESAYFDKLGHEIGKLVTEDTIDLSAAEYKDYYDKMIFATSDGGELSLDEVRKLASGGKVTVSKPLLSAALTKNLQHFKGEGVRLELAAVFQILIDINETETKKNQLDISVTIVFEQEFALGVDIDWDITWQVIIPVDLDISIGLRAGTFSGFGVFATIKTKAESVNKDKAWADIININNANLGDGSQITATNAINKLNGLANDLTKLKDGLKVMDGVGVSTDQELKEDQKVGAVEGQSPGTGGGLMEKYSAMLKNDSQYVRILEKNLVTLDFSPDPLHIIDFSLDINFIISFKVNAMVGFSISYGNAKQLSYNFCAAKKEGTENNADLETPNFRVDFFAFGMIGIRVGFEFDARVGIVSTRFDSLGVLVEFGVAFEGYGFFYAAFYWESGSGTDTEMYGSLLFRIGFYLNVDFYAQLGNGKLGKKINIYSNDWDLFTLGAEFFPMDFEIAKDSPKLKIKTDENNQAKIPAEFYQIKGMLVKNGDKEVRTVSPGEFVVKTNNPAFAFDKTYNRITVDVNKLPANSSHAEAEMTFTYINNTFGINSEAISRTIKVEWNKSVRTLIHKDYETKENVYEGQFVYGSTSAGTAILEEIKNAKTGYRFKGFVEANGKVWTIEESTGLAALVFISMLGIGYSDEHPIYLIYEKNNYTVNWVVDGIVEKTEVLPYGTKLTAPELTKEGRYLGTWRVDGEELANNATVPAKDITINASWLTEHEHIWTDETVKQEATCSQTGILEYTCSFCGERKQEVQSVAPENHKGDIITENYLAGTCSKEGYSGDDRCTACGQIVNVGSATPKDPENHNMEPGHVAKEGNCTEKTVIEAVCSWCGHKTETEGETNPSKHTGKTTTELIKAATCSTVGSQNVLCADCGEKLSTEEIAVNPDNHVSKSVTENASEATCSKEGYTGDEVCPDCHAVLKKGSVIAIDPQAHKWDAGVKHDMEYIQSDDIFGYDTIKAPYTVYTCSECKTTRKEVQKIKASIFGTEMIYKGLLLDWECEKVSDFEPTGFVFAAVVINGERHDTTGFELGTNDRIVWAEDYSDIKVANINSDLKLKAKYLPGDTENFESFEFEIVLKLAEPVF